MTRSRLALLLALAGALLFTAPIQSAEQALVQASSSWRYNATGVNLGSGWRSIAYNDSSWPTGTAELGYGDGDESTSIPYGSSTSNRYPTYYFRKSFVVSDPAAFSALTLRFVRDDGAVIYLNGTEVTRSNMPSGAIAYATLATTAIGGADEAAWQQVPVPLSLLVAGTNVIAVEIHQSSASSSDVSFNLELLGTDNLPPPPTVALLTPADGTVTNSTPVTFTAQASAPAGLASAALAFTGLSQTAVFTGPDAIDDTQLTSGTSSPAGGSIAVNVDGQSPHAHAVMRFPTLIGPGPGQISAGSAIVSAALQVNCTNAGQSMRLYRLTEDWVESQATWTERRTGVNWAAAGGDGAGSNAQAALAGDCTSTGLRSFSITRFVQEWSDGQPNFGLVFTDSGTDGVDFDSSESASSPVLTVVYRGASTVVATTALSGQAATIEFPVSLPVGPTRYWNVEVTDLLGRRSSAPAAYAVTVDTSAPNAPVLVTPGEGAAGVSTSPSLAAIVSDPGGGAVTATVSLRRAAGEPFTIIAMPDTQNYSEFYPDVFRSQTQWIVDQAIARNIVFVTHEGDVVNHNTSVAEYDVADANLSMLDGVVPYGIGPGNHDQPTTLFNQYFGVQRYANEPWYGGNYGTTNDNNYQLFSAGGLDFVIVHLTFCPGAAQVAWADSVYKQYPERVGIMTTHGYLNESAQRTVSGCSNTQYLWDNLALTNPNLHFMLSGHVHDESRRTDMANGHPVYQMLADYQSRANGGDGWLRILRFVPADDMVYVQTYSTWRNEYETDANSQFVLPFPMGGAFTGIASASVASGATITASPTGLLPDTRYEWQVSVTNAAGRRTVGPVWSFTTAGARVNRPPGAQSQSRTTAEDVGAAITLGASDPDGDALTYTIVTPPAHGTLSGTAPTVVYTPAVNYNGPDGFAFRVNDGQANSNDATVSITILPVNDPPTGAGNAYSTAVDTPLAVVAPGVLGNDADPDNASLTAVLNSGVSNGALALNADGSFTYSPNAGFSGSDGFTYRASDGVAASPAIAVSIAVTPTPPATTVLSASFNADQDGFSYLDNAFRGTTQGAYASGSRVAGGGYTGGALRVLLGGVNNEGITNMSGGWSRSFTLTSPRALVLTFRYNLTLSADYEADELSQVLASLNGRLVSATAADYVAQRAGGGATTGWQQVQIPLGTLPAGTHTIRLGGYNNKKTASNEQTTILIDDVIVGS